MFIFVLRADRGLDRWRSGFSSPRNTQASVRSSSWCMRIIPVRSHLTAVRSQLAPNQGLRCCEQTLVPFLAIRTCRSTHRQDNCISIWVWCTAVKPHSSFFASTANNVMFFQIWTYWGNAQQPQRQRLLCRVPPQMAQNSGYTIDCTLCQVLIPATSGKLAISHFERPITRRLGSARSYTELWVLFSLSESITSITDIISLAVRLSPYSSELYFNISIII